MIANLLLIFGVAVLSIALRSFQTPLLFRLGTLGIVATSFLAGWLLGGHLWVGAVCAFSWLFLPWLEILTRVRRLRLPINRILAPRTPPTRHAFPGFDEITKEIEAEGFEYLEDIGWEFEDNRQFYRVFNHADQKSQATICLVEQNDIAFYYLSLTSRTNDGRIFMTWNYPFSYGLKAIPKLKINRVTGKIAFSQISFSHQKFLNARGVADAPMIDQTPENILVAMQNEMRAQILHNLNLGLLKREGNNLIRYTARGMFYLWVQFLRDLVRLS